MPCDTSREQEALPLVLSQSPRASVVRDHVPARLQEAQRQAQADQFKAQNDQASNQVDVFNAQTNRAKVEVDAQVAGANIRFTSVKTEGQQIDNVLNMTQPFRARADEDRKESKAQIASHDFEFDPATGRMTNARN